MGLPVLCTYSKMLLQEHFETSNDMPLKLGDRIVLSTRRGLEVGRVAALPGATELHRDEGIAGRVVRRATPEDLKHKHDELVTVRTPQAVKDARRMVRELKIQMRIEDVEVTLDDARYIFYFTAEGRVDFRELVRRMANQFGKRIELRQIGARDVARLAGDVDVCGEELCCKTFLIDFIPVSMKMAKNQGMSLDQSKVSGVCGRLKCCLKYEDDLYTELRATVPMQGQPVTVAGAAGWAFAVNILNQIITVDINGKREDYPVSAVTFEKMSEREVRSWQKDRWAAIEAEREARRVDKEARKQQRGQPRGHGAPADGPARDAAEPEHHDDAQGGQKPADEHDGSGDAAAEEV